MSQPRIAVVGSVNLDFIIESERLPHPGETEIGGRFSTSPGGKGANQALAARRLGAETALIAHVGADHYAELALDNLRTDGVDLSALTVSGSDATGAAFINVDAQGENQISVASGANLSFSEDYLPASIDADIVLFQLEVPQDVLIAAAKRSGGQIILNTAPALPLEPELLKQVDVLILNEHEHAAYGDSLSDFNGVLVITLGAKGAFVLEQGRELARCSAFPIDVVDTTGAGDCFSGALATALAEGMDYADALRFACAAGALATTRLGAQSALPSKAAVMDLLSVNPG